MLYLTMGSVAAYLKLEPWGIGSEPSADLDDEAEAEAAAAAGEMALSFYMADITMNVLLRLCLVVCEVALFGRGCPTCACSWPSGGIRFRVPGYVPAGASRGRG